MVITLPKARVGLHRLAYEPKLALSYSRNVASSNPQDYCDASSENPGSQLDVTINKDGSVDSVVEGRFIANATIPLEQIPFHLGGRFRVQLPADEAKK